MSQQKILITVPAHTDLRLRSIDQNDIENLRNWKNANKQSFFLNQDITPEQQANWYRNFSAREHDHMFIVEQLHEGAWQSIGCMGFRKLEEEGCVDAYNIIRAVKISPASFTMSEAFLLMLAYAAKLYPGLPLEVKVLSHNPAVAWYQKNHFSIRNTTDNYHRMELDQTILNNINWTVNNQP